jgi:hypothetical protein
MPTTNRGQHPDIDPDTGYLKADAYVDPVRRDFNRMMQDPAQRAHFMSHIDEWQRRLPVDVQQFVQGQTYAAGQDTYTGYLQYRETVDAAQQAWHGGEVTSDDVARMTDEQYAQVFNEKGQLRAGYTFRTTPRDVRIDDAMDSATRREFGNRGGRP